jgi:hypothetical protein
MMKKEKNCDTCAHHYRAFNGIVSASVCKLGKLIPTPNKFFPEKHCCSDYKRIRFWHKKLSLQLLLLLIVIPSLLFSANFNNNKKRTVFWDNPNALEMKTGKKVSYEEFCKVALKTITWVKELDLKNVYEYWDGDIEAFVSYFEKYPTCIPLQELN